MVFTAVIAIRFPDTDPFVLHLPLQSRIWPKPLMNRAIAHWQMYLQHIAGLHLLGIQGVVYIGLNLGRE